MITSTRIILRLLSLLILYLTVSGPLVAQEGPVLNWEWKKVPAKPATLQGAEGKSIIIIVEKITESADIKDFFQKTMVTSKKGKFTDPLSKRINIWGGDNAADSIIKIYVDKKSIDSFLLSTFMEPVAGDTIIVQPFLGAGVDPEGKKSTKTILVDTTSAAGDTDQDEVNNKPGTSNTVPDIRAVGSWMFIPLGRMEVDWASKVACCEFLTAPKMNKHTRWAITYDYNTGDPVAVWRRSDKATDNAGCCDAAPQEGKKKNNKSKNEKQNEDTSIAIKIIMQAAALEKDWLALERVVKDTVLRQRVTRVRTTITALYESVKHSMNEAEQNAALSKLQEIKEQIAIIRAMNGVMPAAAHQPVASEKGCCSEVYCGIQAKRFAPTVKRNVLISVINFHPYRDSFSLVVSYDDQFGQDMALFNTTFNGLSANSQAAAPKTDTTKLTAGEKKGLEEKEGDRYLKAFETLRQELKWYYTSKIQQAHLDPAVVENGVSYIKQRMSDVLGVTDFTEAGIVKRAEEVSDLVTKTGKKLEPFFATAREAAAWWGRVANYKIFDNKSVLVRNKDVMNIVLKRYTYGRLVSSDEEATRSYHTSGGFKIDFSVGLFGNFITDKMYTTKPVSIGNDTAFFRESNGVVNRDSIVSITAASRDSIIFDDHGKFNLGPAVYTHFYWRTGFDLNLGGTIGLAINQEALPRYLFGGSLLIGRDQRLVITTGLSCGPAKELGAGLKEGDKIQLSNFANSTLPTRDVWQNKWFVGVSWNFAGINVGK